MCVTSLVRYTVHGRGRLGVTRQPGRRSGCKPPPMGSRQCVRRSSCHGDPIWQDGLQENRPRGPMQEISLKPLSMTGEHRQFESSLIAQTSPSSIQIVYVLCENQRELKPVTTPYLLQTVNFGIMQISASAGTRAASTRPRRKARVRVEQTSGQLYTSPVAPSMSYPCVIRCPHGPLSPTFSAP